jgi:hypothetical protein
MSDDGQTIRGINWRETFPFTHLFRAFRIAIHPSKLMLGLIALLALYAGGLFLDNIWSHKNLAVPDEVTKYEQNVRAGGSAAEFEHARQREWDHIEQAYAAKLLDYGIDKTRDQADTDAAAGDKLGAITQVILQRRGDRVAQAKRDLDAAFAAAGKMTDHTAADHARINAQDAYNSAVSDAYHDARQDLLSARSIDGIGLFHTFFNYEATQFVAVIHGVAQSNWLGTRDSTRGAGVVASVINFFTIGPVWLLRHHTFYFIIYALWFLTIWAVFGGAIARIAAVHVTRDEKLSLRAALAFSLGKFLSFVSAPVIPLIIVLIVGLVPLISGLLMSIPWGIGAVLSIIITALFALVLAAGFVMTLVLLGTFGGFNLMYPTIAIEGSDSFDAISRSFSYVYARPWRMLFYTAVALIYGAICYLFVRMFIWLMLALTHHFVAAGMFASAASTDPLWTTMWNGPAAPGWRLSYDIDFLTLTWYQSIAAFLLAIWVYLVVATLGAFTISFYFTANTIIYSLMRHEVDATEMDDVYLEQSEEEFIESPGAEGPVSSETVTLTTIRPTDGEPAPAPATPVVDSKTSASDQPPSA